MGRIGKTSALLIIALFLFPTFTLQQTTAKTQQNNQAPNIQFQREYNSTNVNSTESVSNLLQTTDGGYAFLDKGWMHGLANLQPATFFKVDLTGKIQWVKPIDDFIGHDLIQTNDNGYQLVGEWTTYGTTDQLTPTLLKTDANGNIQWYINKTKSPIYTLDYPFFTLDYSQIRTSDGGFASVSMNGSLIKTDSSNQTQWTYEFCRSPQSRLFL